MAGRFKSACADFSAHSAHGSAYRRDCEDCCCVGWIGISTIGRVLGIAGEAEFTFVSVGLGLYVTVVGAVLLLIGSLAPLQSKQKAVG